MRSRAWVALLVAVLGCAVSVSLAGAAPVRVGSKVFTESTVLAEIATQTLTSGGVPALHRRDLAGSTQVLWRALRGNEIDLYVEYTGTIARDLLKDGTLRTPAELRAQLAALGIGVSDSLGFNDTYALGVPRALAQRLGLHRIGDLASHPGLRLGFTHEFLDRPEGWPSLRTRYRLPQVPLGLDHDLSYRALVAGTLDVTDLYSTDAEIEAQELVVLEDDQHHFPEYLAVFLYRLDLPSRSPQALPRLDVLLGRISAAQMVAMNAAVKLRKQPESAVAADYLRKTLGIVQASVASPGWRVRAAAIAQRTREHLGMVGLSLLLAVLVAVPLGVLAARRPRLGQTLLGGLGMIQTVPSLALLVFMIPLLGIGTAPAVVALFLYSLLPIVRNTCQGLRDIPPGLAESARALGLPAWTRLFRIELPMASRAILAGIKTAAVINVGTATLGALIGAGGYGQPILIGIRRDDLGTILEGAIPAALLALLVQGAFELAERVVIPRGLRS